MNNSPKHTPGPWVWVSDGYCTQLLDANGEVVMDDGSAGGEYAPVIEPDSANAHLIAAAPELLEALRELLAMSPAKAPAAGLIVGIEDRHSKAIKSARAAIAKARGTSTDKPTGETP